MEFRVYRKDKKWEQLAQFHVGEHATWFCLYYINKEQNDQGLHDDVKIMKGKKNWKSFKSSPADL